MFMYLFNSILLISISLRSASCTNDGKYDTLKVTDEAWFEFEIKAHDNTGDFRGNITIALFGEVVPMTAMNFLAITKGYSRNDESLHYKGSKVHRIVPDFVIQMGDVTEGDGTGGKSIYGERFNDENFELSHRGAGWVSMANHGPDTNGSQFFILLTRARWLDGKHVVFGKVIHGMNVVHTLGEVKADPNSAVPYKAVRIANCGIINLDKKYKLYKTDLDSDHDIIADE